MYNGSYLDNNPNTWDEQHNPWALSTSTAISTRIAAVSSLEHIQEIERQQQKEAQDGQGIQK
jgi:hypothetical protein